MAGPRERYGLAPSATSYGQASSTFSESSRLRDALVTGRPRTVEGVLLDILLPIRCAACGIPGPLLRRCRDALIRLAPPLCDRCGSPRRLAGQALRRVQRPAPRVRERTGCDRLRRAANARPAWKERGLRVLAREAAALVAESRPAACSGLRSCRPTGSGPTRGHRPAEALARELGKVWELPVSPLVRRARRPSVSAGSASQERRRNVRGAFASAPRRGARLPRRRRLHERRDRRAAASALRRGGAAVEVVTFARAVAGEIDWLFRWRRPPDGGDAMRSRSKARTSRSAMRSGPTRRRSSASSSGSWPSRRRSSSS